MKKDTEKKQKFADEFKKCGNQSEAYRRAYNTEGMKAETIASEASRLMNDPHVTARLENIQEEINKDTILSAQQLQEELTKYIKGQKEEECIVTEGTGKGYSQARLINKKVTPKDKLKAIELLAKIAGYDQSEKVAPITINFGRNYD